MKKILSITPASHATDLALLLARIGIAVLMLTHGIPKLGVLLSGDPVTFPSVMGMSAELSLGLAVFAEVLCSLFLLAGLATRLAVIPLMSTMAIAALFIHAADPFGIKEPALLYLLVYLVLLLAGGGKYSLDYLLQTATEKNKQAALEEPMPASSIS
ncbi:DoxX family protein [Rhodocytophaga rosea]|uniref:DoxX family protein n=1 Tax=Rhodocytophaga rosea TaxID=2704465 RepID=A0A6C0GU53_9BACT|nr:DoxX family protein [Rhodocytophaga rosea]QHT71715.1 DoxX family protein [Rhodocytophaga rosea]